MEPISMALGFVGKNWKAVLFAGVVAVAGVQTWRVSNLKADVREEREAQVNPVTGAKWRDEAVSCAKDRQNLIDGLAAQNRAVEGLKAQGDRLASEAEKAALAARTASALADRRARELAGFKSGETCAAREDNIRKLVEGVQ